MKTMVKSLSFGILAIMLVFTLISCKEDESDRVISIAAIQGLTVPSAGGTPVAEIAPSGQYTGTVVWAPADEVFKNKTAYFATVTLTPKSGYILEGVPADFFTVAGANKVNNDANSGVVYVVFPRLAGSIDDPAVIDISVIDGITPTAGAAPKDAITPTAQFTGDVTWSPADNPFKASVIYTATITLKPRTGFTLTGVTADFFKVTGAETTNNDADSDIVTAVFTNSHIHSWGNWIVTTPATCISEGEEERVCYHDESHKETQKIPIDPDAHDWTVETTITSIDSVTGIMTCSHDSTHKETHSGTLEIFLAELPNNTATSAYTLKLNVNTTEGIRAALQNNNNKYVNLDLSGSTLTTIDGGAFRECAGLTGITIPNGVISIEGSAFDSCRSLTSVIIPDSVTSIGSNAFYWCSNLTSVNIPNGVISIGNYAFGDMGLTGVSIPNSVTSIGDSAFMRCANLTAINVDSANANYSSEQGVLYNKAKTTLIQYPSGKTGAFTIPNGVTIIGRLSFDSCNGLTGITIPSGVTRINYMAFSRSRNLTSVIIPDSVTNIESCVFEDCTGLKSVTLPTNSSFTRIENYTFCNTGLTGITIPNSVTYIGEAAFFTCPGLTSITIPDSITSIRRQAFDNCTSLTSVTFKGTIDSDKFGSETGDGYGLYSPFIGDLREKYLAGGPGTYTRPNTSSTTWTKVS